MTWECIGYWNDYDPYRELGVEDLHKCRFLNDEDIETYLLNKQIHPDCPVIEVPKEIEYDLFKLINDNK